MIFHDLEYREEDADIELCIPVKRPAGAVPSDVFRARSCRVEGHLQPLQHHLHRGIRIDLAVRLDEGVCRSGEQPKMMIYRGDLHECSASR